MKSFKMHTRYCSVCSSESIELFKEVGSFSYYECKDCDVIFISQDVMSKIDAGEGLIKYTESYWNEELYAAKERSWGPSLARVAEVFLYARVPIRESARAYGQ